MIIAMLNDAYDASNDPMVNGWRDYLAGKLTWTELQTHQDAQFPRCVQHGQPAKATLHGQHVCVQCIQETLEALGPHDEATTKGRSR